MTQLGKELDNAVLGKFVVEIDLIKDATLASTVRNYEDEVRAMCASAIKMEQVKKEMQEVMAEVIEEDKRLRGARDNLNKIDFPL